MKPQVIAKALASAQGNHAAALVRAMSLTGDAAEAAWAVVADDRRVINNLCVLLATASLERES